ncbi:MAG: hypothetical protein AB1641_13700 [Thermodesulfobacteriota bacterium]
MKKVLIVLAVLVVIIAAAALGANYYLQMKMSQEVDRFIKGLPELITGSYDRVSYSLLDRKLSIPNLKLQFKKEDAKNLEIAKIEIQDPNLGAWDKMFSDSSGGGSRQKLAKSVIFTNYRTYDKSAAAVVSQLTLTEPSAGPFPFPSSTSIKDVFSEKNLPKVMTAVAAAQFEMVKLEATEPANKKMIGSLARLTIKDIDGGRIGQLVMENLEAQGGERQRVFLKSLRADKLDHSELLGLLAQGKTPEQGTGNLINFDRVTLSGLEISSPQAENVKVQEVSLSNYKKIGLVPASLLFDLKGLALEVGKLDDEKAREGLKMLGYEQLFINVILDFNWVAQDKRFDLRKFSVGVKDAADLILSFSLDGVDLAGVAAPADALSLLGGMLLKKVELRYTDASLLNRALKLAAQANGLAPEEFREMLIQQVKSQDVSLGGISSPKVTESLIAFLQNPRSLTLVAEPKAPLPFMMMAGQVKHAPDRLVADLNLSLTVNDLAPIKIETKPVGPASPQTSAPQPEKPKAEPQKKPEAGTEPAPKAAKEFKIKSWQDLFKMKPGPSTADEGGEIKAVPLK